MHMLQVILTCQHWCGIKLPQLHTMRRHRQESFVYVIKIFQKARSSQQFFNFVEGSLLFWLPHPWLGMSEELVPFAKDWRAFYSDVCWKDFLQIKPISCLPAAAVRGVIPRVCHHKHSLWSLTLHSPTIWCRIWSCNLPAHHEDVVARTANGLCLYWWHSGGCKDRGGTHY